MGAHGFKSASIFFIPFQVDTEWELLETSVRSPIFPEPRLFARGVIDTAGLGLTLPLNITIQVSPIATPVQQFAAMKLTADIDQNLGVGLGANATGFLVNQSTVNVLL